VKYSQWQEAIKNREGLETSLFNAMQRYVYYERQLGRQESDISLPQFDALDSDRLLKFKFKADEPEIGRRTVAVDIAQDLGGSGGKIVNRHEAEDLEKSAMARDIQDAARVGKMLAQVVRVIPDFNVDLHFWGLGGHIGIGGTTLGEVMSYGAEILSI